MTLATIVALLLFLVFLFLEGRDFIRESETSKPAEDPEELMVDLLHLVETGQLDDFTSLIAYYGSNKSRHTKYSLLPGINEEYEKSKRYFDLLNNTIVDLQKLDSYPRKEKIEYSLTVRNSSNVRVNNLDVHRVELSYCDQNGENCIGSTHRFDFIKGEAEYLLLDINGLGLYK